MTKEEKDFVTNFANNLRHYMNEAKYTQYDLAKDTGISTGNISNYINGRITPTAYKIYLIAKVLNCKPSDLYGY